MRERCTNGYHNYEQAKHKTTMNVGPYETNHVTEYENILFCTTCGDVKEL